jgi:Flp pilus assembly protein TadG
MKPDMKADTKRTARGATTLEFALVLLVFLMFLLGVTDVARMLFTWNAASEATRLGARFAVVCADTTSDAQVLAKMRMMVPEIGAINLAWSPAACTAATCEGVTVTIATLNFRWISPIVGSVIPPRALPSFSTYLPREMMRQDVNNAVICQ